MDATWMLRIGLWSPGSENAIYGLLLGKMLKLFFLRFPWPNLTDENYDLIKGMKIKRLIIYSGGSSLVADVMQNHRFNNGPSTDDDLTLTTSPSVGIYYEKILNPRDYTCLNHEEIVRVHKRKRTYINCDSHGIKIRVRFFLVYTCFMRDNEFLFDSH